MTFLFPPYSLIVSCQALEGEPLHGSHYMSAMAAAARMGGAVGIRANGARDIAAIRQTVDLPVIGLNKRQAAGFDVYITPTLADAIDVHAAGAAVVAIDGTGRPRPDGLTLAETIRELHKRGAAVMADVSTFSEGVAAAEAGADYVSTTLSGYTPYSRQEPGPDLELVRRLAGQLAIPIVAEGKISSPDEAAAAIEAGATLVVVGGAITRPQSITSSFVEGIRHRSGGGSGESAT